MIDLLRRNRRYARLWGGESISMLGDQVTALALPMIAILLLHAPAWQLGVLTAASWVPYLFALLTGTAVDRVTSKRRILVLTDLARAAALASIPVAALIGRLTVGQLIMVAVLVGLAGSVSQTAYISFFARLVHTDDVITANSLNSTARSVTEIGGPPAAGWLIQALSAPAALLVDSASYLVSALSVIGIRLDEPRPERQHQHVLRGAVEGLRTMLRDRWLSSILWCTSTMNLANFAILAVVLVFATRTLRLSAGQIGTAQGIGAFGALAGALLASRLSKRIGLFPITMIGTVLFSLPFVIFAVIPESTPAPSKIIGYAGCAFVVTGGIMLYDITINSVMIKVIPEDMRGRLVGAFSSINYGIRPVGALLGGAAAGWWGPRATILTAAVVGLLAVLPLARSPLRRCRTLADVVAVRGDLSDSSSR
ncbi:Predicted arabinose efflux permease, MFS family [Microlunatus soli]|uniref:Predicted arabinose efflux permease, MFS family n=2 Tax=Microlunatus soli TaxID=630515 RepID=A0A1H1TEA3_9ACTN|nr:Predicted arabinose efflux permease, MFS family [Microlunatus soli]